MEFNLMQAVAVLNRTPQFLRSMLSGIPDVWIDNNEGEDTWSPFVVVGHLIHGERTDWIVRARIILDSGENRAFEPFDMSAQFEESRGKTMAELLDTFETMRGDNLRSLKEMNLTPLDLRKTGQHPSLGQVTLEQLLATWVVHDLTHIVQISRTMASQYRDAVGPWRDYLSVLK